MACPRRQATLRGVIARHHVDRKRMAILSEDEGKGAANMPSRITVCASRLGKPRWSNAALKRAHPSGSRHMASIGHPLVGDPVYCRSQKSLKPLLSELGFARQSLHAAVLGFIHPVSGKTIRFASDLPADMRELLARLGSIHADQPGFYLPDPAMAGAWPPPRDAY
jgi:23S rRNA pseudouridine1911/1915/1917 synthase